MRKQQILEYGEKLLYKRLKKKEKKFFQKGCRKSMEEMDALRELRYWIRSYHFNNTYGR
jgi:hypothetical protein